jgi:leader peptidase (prepilin peptidase)/N-methyltransferase
MQVGVNITLHVVAFALGAAAGSFLGRLVYRIPRGLIFVRGFSFCPHCGHRLTLRDLIPLVSYFALRRRCRYCDVHISTRYLVIELVCGGCAVCSWAAFMSVFAQTGPLLVANAAFFGAAAPVLAALLYFCVLGILLLVTYIDTETREIPNGLCLALLVCGVLAIFVAPELTLASRVVGLVCVSVPLLLLIVLIPNAFGGGDVKLLAAAGFLLGWQNIVVAAAIGILIGGIYGVYLMVFGEKGAKDHFAFGPALCVGIATALFFGSRIIVWW